MRRARRSRRIAGLLPAALGFALPLAATGPSAAFDLFTYTNQESTDFRLSGDGNWFAYTYFEFPPGVATVLGPDGATLLPGQSNVTGLSFDGSVVVGSLYDGGIRNGYVLKDGIYTTIGDFATNGSHGSAANAVSRDGTVVVGAARVDNSPSHAFRWSNGILTDLGVLPGGSSSNAMLVSRDGKAVGGDSHVGAFDIAFIWTTDHPVMTPLGSLGGTGSYGFAMSADGSTIVGRADTDPTLYLPRAFRWTAETGMVDLGTFGGPFSEANAVSFDGSVVVGGAEVQPGRVHAFRWTEAGGMVDLGTVNDVERGSGAYAVSDDGSVVVGSSDLEGSGTTGFRWEAQDGMLAVADYLTRAGVDVGGWTFISANALSADGHTMAGYGNDGLSYGVWYARCNPDADDACAVTSTGGTALSLASLEPLAQSGNSYLEDDFAALANVLDHSGSGVSATTYGLYDSDPAAGAGIIVTARPGDAFAAALGFGVAHIWTPLDLGGSASFDAASFSASLGLQPEQGFTARLAVTGALFDGTVRRGYRNGNTQVNSSGDTSAHGLGIEALAGWRAQLADSISLLAFASLGVERTAYAGWTETGGPFPATMGDFAATSTLLRAGVTVDHDFEGGISGSAGLALVHRQSSGTPISGVVPGLLAMDIPSADGSADWLELSAALAVPLAAGTVQFDLMGRIPATGDPSVAAQVGLSLPL